MDIDAEISELYTYERHLYVTIWTRNLAVFMKKLFIEEKLGVSKNLGEAVANDAEHSRCGYYSRID